MPDAGFTLIANDELTAILQAGLSRGGGQISREIDLLMAHVVAAHLANHLATAGLRVIRPRPPEQWLLP